MDQDIVKGVITGSKYVKKYDGNGNPYKDYTIIVGNQEYTTQTKEDIYLQDGMNVIMEIKPGSTHEVITGYCIKEGYGWGQHLDHLKNKIPQSEKYEFLEGIILEKRKSKTGSIYMNRSALSNRGSRISYTIVLENNEFQASRDEGEYLQVGMNIAVVLEQKKSVIILDKGTNRFLGMGRPYFIVFLIALICFNTWMYFSYRANQTHFANFKVTLIVINIFLILAFVLSIATFKITGVAKKFLLSEMKK
jgi:hypothetical protein